MSLPAINEAPLKTLRFLLPYPPSVNALWRSTQRGVFSSERSRLYRKRCSEEILAQQIPRWLRAIRGRLEVHIEVLPPLAARRRDLDNVLKATFDALQHCGVIEDDECFDRILIERRARAAAMDAQWDEGVLSLTIRVLEGDQGGASR